MLGLSVIGFYTSAIVLSAITVFSGIAFYIQLINMILSTVAAWIGGHAMIWPNRSGDSPYYLVPFIAYIGIIAAIIGIFITNNEFLDKTNELVGYSKNTTVFVIAAILVTISLSALLF